MARSRRARPPPPLAARASATGPGSEAASRLAAAWAWARADSSLLGGRSLSGGMLGGAVASTHRSTTSVTRRSYRALCRFSEECSRWARPRSTRRQAVRRLRRAQMRASGGDKATRGSKGCASGVAQSVTCGETGGASCELGGSGRRRDWLGGTRARWTWEAASRAASRSGRTLASSSEALGLGWAPSVERATASRYRASA
mmetsp:Transcript_31769/g.71484  ORF Transcript_31769/g.71484 Transcript_31769/m.71484 type:complete len:201 (-) Transcript_31769:254-856(-)